MSRTVRILPETTMPSSRKIIITCAITGAAHTPTMSPHLPITPSEIARESIAAAEAGAAILHLHARDPRDGRPTPDPAVFGEFLPRIKQATDAVLNITTGGGAGMTLDDRLAAPLRFRPELASLNMGTMSPTGRHLLAERRTEWRYAWEPDLIRGARSRVYNNSDEVIETILRKLGEAGDTRFECECYDLGHLYNVAHYLDRGLLKPPVFVQTVFGFSGGMGPDPETLAHVRRIADKLFGGDYHWSILAAGRHQLALCTVGAVSGANVRVGLEDSLYLGKGTLARSNAEQVARIRTILELLSFEIATPAEARGMLELKGADQVGF
jgi:uncharacterized protein (DUF849 family)